MQSTTGLRSTSRLSGLPTPAHEKAEEATLAGPPQDRSLIGGLKMRKRAEPVPAPAPPQPPRQSPVFECLNQLAETGRRFVNNADELIEKSFAEKREALVRIGAPYTMVASFNNVEDMQLYTRLATGQEPGGTAHDQTRSKLLELDQKGMSFYFSRDTGPLMGKLPLKGPKAWLRTDAAGATILLERGESLRMLGADGSEQTLSSPRELDQLRSEGSAQKAEVRGLLDYLEGLGTKVEPDFPLPETMLASDYETQYWTQQKNLLTSGFSERPQTSDFLARAKMLTDLAQGGEINLTLPGQTRPVPIDLQQGQQIKKYLTDAHPADFDFNAGFQAVQDQGGKIFARQLHGDARGQLVEAKTALAAYANLAVGGECVVLDPSGDLRGVKSLQDFSLLALGQQTNPRAETFLSDYQACKQGGFVFFKPDGVDERGNVSSWNTPGPVQVLQALSDGKPVLVQKPDGAEPRILYSHEDLANFMGGAGLKSETSAPASPRVTIDPTVPKKNLFMVYYSALHSSDGPLGVYDDFAYKMQQMGSSEDRDLITLRSDKSFKSNLRLDYAQPGRFETVRELDPNTMLSEAHVLENFVYESIKQHPADEKLRLMVLGHGSAEDGVMDDFSALPNGQVKADRIKVDDFAGAIKKALDRIEAETGKRPVIDNLILNSCLMGNTSMLQALAETGDVKAMSASPELMLDSFPAEAITNLQGAVDGKEYAKQLVDTYKDAVAFPDGRSNRVNALVYGAYDCDPQKAATFKSSLKEFFAACTARPDLATYVREDIADCPGYNIHLTGGPGPGFENRDLIQVARRIQGDARVGDERIKAACKSLIEATRAQVLAQRTEKAYEGREGPSIFLPVDAVRYDGRNSEPPTSLLRDTGFKDFIATIQAAAPRTQAHQNALTRLYADQGDSLVKTVMGLVGFNAMGQAVLEQEFVSKLEKPVQASRVRQGLNTALRVVFGTVGGAVGLALGLGTGAAGGALLGARGGLTGHASDDGPGKPMPQPTEPKVPTQNAAGLSDGTLLQVRAQNRTVADDALMASMEGVGSMTNKVVSYRYGSLAGKAAGLPAGVIGGVVTGSTVLGVSGAVVGWQLGNKLADWLLPRS